MCITRAKILSKNPYPVHLRFASNLMFQYLRFVQNIMFEKVDEGLYLRFKEVCKKRGRPMREVIQDLMFVVVDKGRLPEERQR